MNRRRLLALGAAGCCAPVLGPSMISARSGEPRVVALVWELAQTLLALGVEPIAIAETRWYGMYAARPKLPRGTIDVGTRVEPNLELLELLKPDLIAINSMQTSVRSRLEGIAPVADLPIAYSPRGAPASPFDRAVSVTRRLAQLVGRPAAGSELVARTEAELARLRRRVRAASERAVYVATLEDERHLRVYGENSIVADVLARLGLRNASRLAAGPWGFSIVGIEALADDPYAHMILLDAATPDATRPLTDSPVWRALPFVRDSRVTMVSEGIWITGGSLPVAAQLGRIVGDALLSPPLGKPHDAA